MAHVWQLALNNQIQHRCQSAISHRNTAKQLAINRLHQLLLVSLDLIYFLCSPQVKWGSRNGLHTENFIYYFSGVFYSYSVFDFYFFSIIFRFWAVR